MIRMGGGPGAGSDPEQERKAANAAVLKNTAIFGLLILELIVIECTEQLIDV